jgi:hypothetical protein
MRKTSSDPLFALRTHRAVRRLSMGLHRHVLSHLPRSYERSTRSVTLVMPLAVKDLPHAERSIAAWREHLLHPIDEVLLLGQSSPAISALAQKCEARYIDENEILPQAARDFTYPSPRGNLNGWVRQQLLKLSADTVASGENFLIVDSDTRPLRPIPFERGGNPILFTSDEYIITYHRCTQRLLGPLRLYPRSFIAHCMLFERDVLEAMKNAIEARTGRPWIDAILQAIDIREHYGFADYETYGTYVYNRYPERFQAEYWYNKKMNAPPNQDFDSTRVATRFNFTSRHIRAPESRDGSRRL